MGLQLDYRKRYGWKKWCLWAACGVAHRTVGFKALRGMTLEPDDIDPTYLGDAPGFSHHACGALEFALLPDAPKLASEEFFSGASVRGDRCHYMADGDRVASYGWYATAPVPAFDDTWIHFSPAYVYMYKGFTLPEYRGKQLHAYGMARAATEARAQGYTGLISYVEMQNEGSLRSVARLGYRTFGTCVRLRVFGRTLISSSAGCRPYAFKLSVSSEPVVRGGNRESVIPAHLAE
jgi:GNAT superfamily N-acetyltransferase